jgi:hypothetical protein
MLYFLTYNALADVKPAAIFADNMVLQRETKAPVWGLADPGEKVTVIGSWGESASAIADETGKWTTPLQTPEAGGPYTLTIKGKNAIEIQNVLSGEVWFCSGQSNMDFEMLKLAKFKVGRTGEGHSFENCSHLILPALSYAYDENEQFIHRIWRLNSPGPVTIHPIVMRGSIDEKLHEIFMEKADASNLAIDGRLFTEPDQDIDLERVLLETIQAFNHAEDSVDEQELILQWESTSSRQLRHAALQFNEHKKIDAGVTDDEIRAALIAAQIPSPTQLTVDICRKKFKEGKTKFPSKKDIKKLTATLAAKNKTKRKKK